MRELRVTGIEWLAHGVASLEEPGKLVRSQSPALNHSSCCTHVPECLAYFYPSSHEPSENPHSVKGNMKSPRTRGTLQVFLGGLAGHHECLAISWSPPRQGCQTGAKSTRRQHQNYPEEALITSCIYFYTSKEPSHTGHHSQAQYRNGKHFLWSGHVRSKNLKSWKIFL